MPRKVKPFPGFGKDSLLGGVFAGTVLFIVISDDRSIVLRLLMDFVEVEIDSFPVSLFFLSNGLIEHYFRCLIIASEISLLIIFRLVFVEIHSLIKLI